MFGCQSQELDPIKATEVTTLLFACINSIAMRMNLPNGGYGAVGVCNDSSAIVEATVRGQTDIYPLVHIGGFFYQVVNRAEELVEYIRKNPNTFHRLHWTKPRNCTNPCMPEKPPFMEMEETIRILKEEFPVMKK
jgi:hypothetical protein